MLAGYSKPIDNGNPPQLLQTRTKTLDGTLRDLFTRSYPDMAVNDNQVPVIAVAA